MKNSSLTIIFLFVHMWMIFGSQEIGSKVYYFSARFYDSKIGRFISSDPLVPEVQSHKGLNHYSYVYNNPLKYKDPTGHVPFFQDAGGQEEPSTMSLVLDIALNIGLDILDMVADTGDYLIDAMLPPKVSQNSVYGPELFVFDEEFLEFLFGTVGGGGKTGPLDDGVRRLSKQGPKGKIVGRIDLDAPARLASLKKKLNAVKDPEEALRLLGSDEMKMAKDFYGNAVKVGKVDLRPQTEAGVALGLKDLQDQLDYLIRLGKPGEDTGYMLRYVLKGIYAHDKVLEASRAWQMGGPNFRASPTKANLRRRKKRSPTHAEQYRSGKHQTAERRVRLQKLDANNKVEFEILIQERWSAQDLDHARRRLMHGS